MTTEAGILKPISEETLPTVEQNPSYGAAIAKDNSRILHKIAEGETLHSIAVGLLGTSEGDILVEAPSRESLKDICEDSDEINKKDLSSEAEAANMNSLRGEKQSESSIVDIEGENLEPIAVKDVEEDTVAEDEKTDNQIDSVSFKEAALQNGKIIGEKIEKGGHLASNEQSIEATEEKYDVNKELWGRETSDVNPEMTIDEVNNDQLEISTSELDSTIQEVVDPSEDRENESLKDDKLTDQSPHTASVTQVPVEESLQKEGLVKYHSDSLPEDHILETIGASQNTEKYAALNEETPVVESMVASQDLDFGNLGDKVDGKKLEKTIYLVPEEQIKVEDGGKSEVKESTKEQCLENDGSKGKGKEMPVKESPIPQLSVEKSFQEDDTSSDRLKKESYVEPEQIQTISATTAEAEACKKEERESELVENRITGKDLEYTSSTAMEKGPKTAHTSEKIKNEELWEKKQPYDGPKGVFISADMDVSSIQNEEVNITDTEETNGLMNEENNLQTIETINTNEILDRGNNTNKELEAQPAILAVEATSLQQAESKGEKFEDAFNHKSDDKYPKAFEIKDEKTDKGNSDASSATQLTEDTHLLNEEKEIEKIVEISEVVHDEDQCQEKVQDCDEVDAQVTKCDMPEVSEAQAENGLKGDEAKEGLDNEKLETVSEDKQVKPMAEIGLSNDEIYNNKGDGISTTEPSEKENTQGPPEVKTIEELGPTGDETEGGKLESILDAVPQELEASGGMTNPEKENINKEDSVMNVAEINQDKKKCEEIEKVAADLIHEYQNTKKDLSNETETADKTNEENTDENVDDLPVALEMVEETIQGEQMHEIATKPISEELIHDADDNVDQMTRVTEPENPEKASESESQYHIPQTVAVAEATNVDISGDGISMDKTIGGTLSTSQASMEENTQEKMDPDEAEGKNSTAIHDNEGMGRHTQGVLEVVAEKEIHESTEDNSIMKNIDFENKETDEATAEMGLHMEQMEGENLDSDTSPEKSSTEETPDHDLKKDKWDDKLEYSPGPASDRIIMSEESASAENVEGKDHLEKQESFKKGDVNVMLEEAIVGTDAEDSSNKPYSKAVENITTNDLCEETEAAIEKNENSSMNVGSLRVERELVEETSREGGEIHEDATISVCEELNQNANGNLDLIKQKTEAENSEKKTSQSVSEVNSHDTIIVAEFTHIDTSVEGNSTEETIGDLSISQASKNENTLRETDSEEVKGHISTATNENERHYKNIRDTEVGAEKDIHERTEENRSVESTVFEDEKNAEATAGMNSHELTESEELDKRNELEQGKESSEVAVHGHIFLEDTTAEESLDGVLQKDEWEDKFENSSDVVSEKIIVAKESASTEDVEEKDLSEKQEENFQEKHEVGMILEQAVGVMETGDQSYKPDYAHQEYIHDGVGDEHEGSPTFAREEQTHEITKKENMEIDEQNEEISQKLELESESVPKAKSHKSTSEMEAIQIENSTDDDNIKSKIPEMIEPNDEAETAKDEDNLNKDVGDNPDSHVLIEETIHDAVGEKHEEEPNTTCEDQIPQTTNTKENIEVDACEEQKETEQLEIISESLHEDKNQEATGESEAIETDNSTDDDKPNKVIPEISGLSDDTETPKVKDKENLNKNIEWHAMVVQTIPDAIGEKHEEASEIVCEEQINKTSNGEDHIELDVHKEKTGPEKLEIISESVPRDHSKETAGEPKATKIDNSTCDDNLNKKIPEMVDLNENPAKVKEEDILEKNIGDISDTHLLAVEAFDHNEKPETAEVEESDTTTLAQNFETLAEMKPVETQISEESQTMTGDAYEDQSHEEKGECKENTNIIHRIEENENVNNKDEKNTNKIPNDLPVTSASADEAASGNFHGDEGQSETKADNKTTEGIPNQVDSDMRSIEQNLEAMTETEPIKLEISEDNYYNTVAQNKESEAVGITKSDDNLPSIPALIEETRQEVENKHEKTPDSPYEEQTCEGIRTSDSINIDILKENKTEKLERDSASMTKEQNDKIEATFSTNKTVSLLEGDEHGDEGNEVSESMEAKHLEEAKTNDGDVFESSMHSQGMKGDELNNAHGLVSEEKLESLVSEKKQEEELLTKEKALDVYLRIPSNVGSKEPTVATEVEHLSLQSTEKVEAVKGKDEEAKDSDFITQESLKTRDDAISTKEASFDENMQKDASVVVSEGQIHNVLEDINKVEYTILENRNKEEQEVQTSLQKEEVEDEKQEEVDEIQTEMKASETIDTNDTNKRESLEEKENLESYSEKLDDLELENHIHVVPGGTETETAGQDINEDRIENHGAEDNNEENFQKDGDKMLEEETVEFGSSNQSNEPICACDITDSAISHEDIMKTVNVSDDAEKEVASEDNQSRMVDDLSVTHELVGKITNANASDSRLQMESMELETLNKADKKSESTDTGNEEALEKSKKLNASLHKDAEELMQIEEPSNTVSHRIEMADPEKIEKIMAEEDVLKTPHIACVKDETANEEFQEDEDETKKNKEPETKWEPEPADTIPNDEVKEPDCQPSEQSLIMTGSSEELPMDKEDPKKNLDISPVTTSSEETMQEVGENLDEVSVSVPIEYTQEAINTEHPKEETNDAEGPTEIEKFEYTSTESASVHEINVKVKEVADGIPNVLLVMEDTGKDAIDQEGRDKLAEVSNLVSNEEVAEKADSSVKVTEDEENSHKPSVVLEPEVSLKAEEASHEVVELETQNEEKQQMDLDDLPVSQFFMDHILREEGDMPDKAGDVVSEDKKEKGGQKNGVGIPEQEETMVSLSAEQVTEETIISEDKESLNKLENTSSLVQEELYDVKENTENVAGKDDESPQSNLHDSSPIMLVGGAVKDEVPRLSSEVSTHVVTNDSLEQTSEEQSTPQNKVEIEECTDPYSVKDEKIQATMLEKEIIEKEIIKCNEILKKDADVSSFTKASEEDILQKEGGKEGKEILPDVENIDKALYEVSEEKSPSVSEPIQDIMSLVRTEETLPSPHYDKIEKSTESAIIEDYNLGETMENESEVKEVENGEETQDENTGNQVQNLKSDSTEEPKLPESQKVQQSDLVVEAASQTLQRDENLLEKRSAAVSTNENQTKETIGAQEEHKTDEEKDEMEEEEEHKPEESGLEAAVIVEARDADLKPAHKKSHNILSGVGSKVKHSIAKVKKAITGKSSHSKTLSTK